MLKTDTPVCVTGASGFIATELIAALLARGLTVHGTVRSTAPSRTAHLLALPGADARLKLFEADLGGPPAAFTAAAAGCNVVFHTACPFVYSGRAAALGEEYFVAPAVKGTEAVLAACRDAGSVTRVVMTSSCAAIFKKNVPEGHVYDEDSWNDPEELATRKMYYSIGKTKQERAAWAWVEAEKPAFSLVCINPCMVAGGARQPTLNASQESMADFCTGAKALVPNSNMPWVVRSDPRGAALLLPARAAPSAARSHCTPPPPPLFPLTTPARAGCRSTSRTWCRRTWRRATRPRPLGATS
jgi:dihydroflavonol-4-reductase